MECGRRVLLLWDIDHTLIENGGVSKANYALAFELLTGRTPDHRARTGGRTDVEIMESLLADNGEDPVTYPPADQWQALTDAGARNQDLLRDRGGALPGAADTLARLARESWVIQSVLTGNIEANARVKLATFGLDQWIRFDLGAFGSESRVRSHLVPVAQANANERTGFRPGHDVTVLVGDTIRDVRAGVDGAARVLGVATGDASPEDLRAAGAETALSNLVDIEAVVEAVESLRQLGPV